MAHIDPQEIRRIAAIPNPVLRNLQITECYHRLSLAMAAHTGDCANWCTFATWASKQAGRTIRGEDWIDAITENTLTGSVFAHPIRNLWRVLLRKGMLQRSGWIGRFVHAVHSPFDALERASDAVARGNLKVFEEIGFEFARYLQGETIDTPELLRSAFLRYTAQAAEPDPARRAQLVFLANVEIGLHEQTRLQPEIVEALEAGPRTAGDLGLRVLLGPIAWVLRKPARELTRRMITRSLMTLALPDTTLQLGRDIDRAVPESLRECNDALVTRYGAGQSGARDWGDLEQRMRFILPFFRCFHECTDLLKPPFTAARTDALRAGRIPRGQL